MDRLRRDGYLVAVVEKWNPWTKTRHDLYGIGDLLAIRDDETLLVQATSKANVSHRIVKIHANAFLPRLLRAGWRVEVHGWAKAARTGRFECRVVEISALPGADESEGMATR